MTIKLLSNKMRVVVFSVLLFFTSLHLISQTQRTTNLEPCLAPFYHGVASGDPMPTKVIIWTRVTPDTVSMSPIVVTWQMATDTGMTNVVKSGSKLTSNAVDYTVKVDVTGLQPKTWYYYEFTVNGHKSPRGRTRTSPSGNADSLRFAVVSCANYESGFFNAYKILLDRADFDAVVCLGDYIYEYNTGGYGPNPTANRQWLPLNEIISLADYRQRYSTYHLDEDLRKLHQQFPFITIWDDHEFADDTWMNGAVNHTPGTEGPFAVRKANAKQAYFEWLPIRPTAGAIDPYQLFRNLTYGNLVDFIMLDTRLYGRDIQSGTSGAVVEASTRQLLGTSQYSWLGNRLSTSTARWKLLTQQVMFAPLRVAGSAINGDQWDGYPAERDRVMNHIMTNNITDVVVLTGDIHSSWANDIPTSTYDGSTGAGSMGVEFVGPSVTSPGMTIPGGPTAIQLANDHIKYADFTQHGFYILDVNKTRTQCDWFYVTTIDYSSMAYSHAKSMYVNHLERFLRETPSISLPRPSVYGIKAPLCPRVVSLTGIEEFNDLKLLNVFPNPAETQIVLSFLTNDLKNGTVTLYNTLGQNVKQVNFTSADMYNSQLLLDIKDLPVGIYNGTVKRDDKLSFFKFVKN